MTAQKKFTRLRARRRGFIRRASLWDAGEYLLSVSGTAFAERYRRFYYRDIKAVVVQKGPRLGSIGALLLLAFFAFIGLAVALNSPTWALTHLLWVASLTWLIVIVYFNLARSCRVYVYTAVSSEELPAILRQSAAARVVPRIISKVHAAQGEFAAPSEDAAALAESFTRTLSSTESLPAEAVPVPHQALYGSLSFFLVVLLAAGFAFWYRNALLTPQSLLAAKVLFCFLNALGVATGIWALLRVFSIRLFTGLRITIFSGLALMALRSYSLYFTLVELKVKDGSLTETMTGVHWRQWLGTADSALSLIIGIMGLILVTYSWQSETPTPLNKTITPESSVAGGSISSL